MKLHLPKMLTAALLAASTALIAGQQAQAYSRAITEHTTSAGDTTYNGYVFTMQLDKNVNFASRNFKEATYDTQNSQWVDGDTVYVSGNNDVVTPLGTGYFWTMYCSAAGANHGISYGNTLRLTGATSQAKLQTDFSDFAVGGLIADDSFASSYGTPAYWFYRTSSMDLTGTSDVNMDVDSHVRFSYQGAVNMKKGGTWNIHSGKTLTFDNNSSASGKETTFIFYAGQALTVKGGGTLNLGRSQNGTFNVTMQEGSSLHVTGNSTVALGASGTFAANGAITVEAGSALNISLTTTLGHTITNNGNIQFASDTVTLGSLAGFDASGAYTDYSGEETGNGFAGTMVYTIIQGTGTSNLAKVNYGTQTAVALTEGKLTVEGDTDYTKYYVNTDSATISVKSASEYAAQHEGAVLSTVYVKGANDTVNVDANFNGTVEVTGTGAVLNIKEDSTFSGTLTAGTLRGAGTYALANGSTSMGTVTLDGVQWTGTVKLSGVSAMANINLNQYGQAGSKVGMDGVTGYFFQAANAHFAPGLVLTGAGLTLNDGFSALADRTTPTGYLFDGGVSGEGGMTFSKANGDVAQRLYFTGDVEGWTGSLKVVDHFTVYAQFSGEDKQVGASIVRENGTLHVEVGTGGDSSNVTFNNVITNASSLTVQEGASATLKEASTIGALTGTGVLTVDAAGKTVSITGANHTIAETIELVNGTLSLAGAYNLDAMEPTDYNEQYVGPESFARTDSGFHQISGTVQVVNIGGGTLSLAEDATFSYEEADVTVDANTGVGSFSGVDLTTLWVNSDAGAVSYDAAQEYAEQQASGTIVNTVCLNYDGATVAMDRADASVALVLSDEVAAGTVYATENTTISSISGWSGKELVIDGTAIVTTGAVMLDDNDTKLTVEEDATLAITGKNNLTLQHGTATIDGTVTIGHELDLSKGSTSDAELVIGTTGDVTATDGLWLRGGHHFTILDDGQFTTKGLTFIGQGDDSTIALNKVASEDANYSTTEAKFVISNMTIQANQDVTIGNTLDNSTVVTGDHAVTLNSGAASVIVSDGGTFTKGVGVTVGNITVQGTGTIAGEAGIDEVTIDVDATATFDDQSYIGSIEERVYMYSIQTPIVIHNGGEEAAKYTNLHQNGMEVFAETLNSAADDLTVENTVAVGLIQHQGAGSLTLAHVNAEPLDAVEVTNGSLILQDVPAVTLSSMEIASGSTVAVYTDELAEIEGTVTITESLTAGGAALYADLTLVGHELGEETPLLFWDLGGQQMTLGSTLTLDTETGLIQLDNATMQQIAALTLGGNNTWALVLDAPGGTGLEYIGDGWFDGVFSRTYTNAQGAEVSLGGDYKVQMLDSTSFGIVKVSNTPEPTTGTLSLLALAALAARRRRK